MSTIEVSIDVYDMVESPHDAHELGEAIKRKADEMGVICRWREGKLTFRDIPPAQYAEVYIFVTDYITDYIRIK